MIINNNFFTFNSGSNVKASGEPVISDPTAQKCCPTNQQLYEDKLCYRRSCENKLSGIQYKCKYEKANYLYCDCAPENFLNARNECVSIDRCEGYTGPAVVIPVDGTANGEFGEIGSQKQNVCCPENEEIKTVINGCVENTCKRKRQNFQSICRPIFPYPIAEHAFCDCDKDTYRNSKMKCVPFEECDDTTITSA